MKNVLALLFLLGLVAVGFFVLGYNQGRYQQKKSLEGQQPIDSYKVYVLINDYRASQGLKLLRWNPEMCGFAKKRLNDVYTDWSHNHFLEAKNYYNYVKAGENLAKDQWTEKEMVDSWISSPSHLENIIEPKFTDTCIVHGAAPTGSYYTVQEFAQF